MASREEVVGLLALGFVLGGFFMLTFSESSYGTNAVSYEKVNLTQRAIAVDPQSGGRVECSLSRSDEVQIDSMSFVYRNASCESWIELNGITVTMPVKGDVLFRTEDDPSYSIGLDFGDEHVVCRVTEEIEEKIGEASWVYNGADCTGFSGSLYERWNDPEFENFNVHERGRELLQNQTGS